MTVRHIPLITYGSQLGQVNVDDEGIITIVLFPESQLNFGVELAKSIDRGITVGLNLSPVIPPSTPARSPTNSNSNRFG